MWFDDNNNSSLDWPANSPDLNLMRSVSGIIIPNIYQKSDKMVQNNPKAE